MLNTREKRKRCSVSKVGLLRAAGPVCRVWTGTRGRRLFEANGSWQLLSLRPVVKTATLKRTSLCKMSNRKLFVSSFPESRPKSDSEVINLGWLRKECNVL